MLSDSRGHLRETLNQLFDLPPTFLEVRDPAGKLGWIDGPEIHQVQLVSECGGILRKIGKNAVRLIVRPLRRRLVVRRIDGLVGIVVLGPGMAAAHRGGFPRCILILDALRASTTGFSVSYRSWTI